LLEDKELKKEEAFEHGEGYEVYLLHRLWHFVADNTRSRTRAPKELLKILEAIEQFKYGRSF